MADIGNPQRRRAPEFDNKVSTGTILQLITLIGGGIGAFLLVQDQANDNARAIERATQEISQDVQAVRTTVNTAISRLKAEIDNDLDEVTEVVEENTDRVEQVIKVQAISLARIEGAEDDVASLDREHDLTRAIAIQVRSDADRDRAVQAERHESLVDALDEIKQTIRTTN